MMHRNALFLTLFALWGFWLGGCDHEAERKPSELQFVEKAVGKVVPSEVAYKLRQQGEDLVFVEVRERAEWDEYHIPGAIWIPHSRLKEKDEYSWKLLEELANTHKYVLTYCGAGHRSGFWRRKPENVA